jgi:hypothetical protein
MPTLSSWETRYRSGWWDRELMKLPEPPRRGIGFTTVLGDASKCDPSEMNAGFR